MLRWLQRRASEAQFRHFGIACCRRIWHLLTDARSRGAVEAADGFLRGTITAKELDLACDDAEWPYQDANLRAEDPDNPDPGPDRVAEAAAYAAHMLAWPQFGCDTAVEVAVGAAEAAGGQSLPNAESAAQAELLRREVVYPGTQDAEPGATADGGGMEAFPGS
jgi:hypothetical protein